VRVLFGLTCCVPIASHVSTSGNYDECYWHNSTDSTNHPYCEVLRIVLLAHIVLLLELIFASLESELNYIDR